jgi:hypothetical protein
MYPACLISSSISCLKMVSRRLGLWDRFQSMLYASSHRDQPQTPCIVTQGPASNSMHRHTGTSLKLNASSHRGQPQTCMAPLGSNCTFKTCGSRLSKIIHSTKNTNVFLGIQVKQVQNNYFKIQSSCSSIRHCYLTGIS